MSHQEVMAKYTEIFNNLPWHYKLRSKIRHRINFIIYYLTGKWTLFNPERFALEYDEAVERGEFPPQDTISGRMLEVAKRELK